MLWGTTLAFERWQSLCRYGRMRAKRNSCKRSVFYLCYNNKFVILEPATKDPSTVEVYLNSTCFTVPSSPTWILSLRPSHQPFFPSPFPILQKSEIRNPKLTSQAYAPDSPPSLAPAPDVLSASPVSRKSVSGINIFPPTTTPYPFE